MICSNAYTAGDWTLPAIASVVTGQTEVKHKILHPNLLRRISKDTPILYEYFKDAGYNTTKIGGDWRITPTYGYARGVNRMFYGHLYAVYQMENIIADAMEQMRKMRETDQYIWMEIGELHTIADDINLGAVMSEFPILDNVCMQKGKTSVKQDYDDMKIEYYLKQIERVDLKLAALFQYIEANYSDDEILISLFSDHGQGYLVKPEENFLSAGRNKVAFMIRGNGKVGQSDEIISVCDYGALMCQMAGIPFRYENTDAQLPVTFGGNTEREFAITESIHPGDPYQITLNGKDFVFYLKGEENVTSECRVPLEKFTVELTDIEGNELQDEGRKEYYTKYCLDHVAPCVSYKD